MRFLRNFLRSFLFVLLLIFAILFLCLDSLDMERYLDTDYYHTTIENIKTAEISRGSEDVLLAGWASLSILPGGQLRSIGYDRSGNIPGLHDSLYIKSIVLKNGALRAAIISFDLLLVPQEVANRVEERLIDQGFDFVYFGASHTHNGFGHWDSNAASKFILGEYRQNVVDLLFEKACDAVRNAQNLLDTVEATYRQVEIPGSTQNRVFPEGGGKDEYLRVLTLRNMAGKQALLSSFQAHATCLSHSDKKISGDYPGIYNVLLKQRPDVEFSMFMAGGMASHRPVLESSDYASMEAYAENLAQSVSAVSKDASSLESQMSVISVPVGIREPHFRVHPKIRLRPWLFRQLFGKVEPSMKCLKLGKLYLMGFPCEISGELFADMQRSLPDSSFLMPTSFNGDYLGYINADQYYFWNSFEVKDMNWYGPYNGAYFTELTTTIVARMSQP